MNKRCNAAVLLAGGENKRMGFHKAFIELNSKRIIDLTLDILRPLFEEVIIVTNSRNDFCEFEGVKIAEDIVKGRGPLGGIYTALKILSGDRGFFVACDMPFLSGELIKQLRDVSMEDNYDCVLPYTSKRIEPLHAIYSKSTLGIIEDLLKGEDFSVKRLLEKCKCKYVEVNKKEASSFFNVNTQEELRELL